MMEPRFSSYVLGDCPCSLQRHMSVGDSVRRWTPIERRQLGITAAEARWQHSTCAGAGIAQHLMLEEAWASLLQFGDMRSTAL